MTTPSQKHRSCPECGGVDIALGIPISQTAQSNKIGLSYKAIGILRGTAQLYADLCRGCGTIVRLFVRDTDKPWIENK